MDNEFTLIDLLRHGQCEGGEIFRGCATDVALTELGYAQMQAALDSLAQKQWDKILHSPLIRCADFAKATAEKYNIALEENAALREIDFGHWEGRLVHEVWRESPDILSNYFKDPSSYTPEGGESIDNVRQRLERLLAAILSEHKGDRVLLVLHGGIIRLLLTMFLKLPLTAMSQFDVPYGCFTRIKLFHHADVSPVLVTHRGPDL